MAATPLPDRRRSVRRPTAWPARCRTRKGAVLDGSVVDVSATGAFFALGDPARADALLRRVAVGDRVVLGLTERLLGDRSKAATIRWIGYSSTHRLLGLGLELVPTAP